MIYACIINMMPFFFFFLITHVSSERSRFLVSNSVERMKEIDYNEVIVNKIPEVS